MSDSETVLSARLGEPPQKEWTALDGSLTIRFLQYINAKRAERWHGLKSWSALEWAGAMAGEAGEACNAAKKLKRIDDQIANINLEEGRSLTDVENASAKIVDEIADTVIYGVLLAERVGLDLEEAIRMKFNRKSEEYGFPERIPANELAAALTVGAEPPQKMNLIKPVLYVQTADGTFQAADAATRAWAEPGTHGLQRYNCDCLNAGPDGAPSDDPDAVYVERWVYLADAVDVVIAGAVRVPSPQPPVCHVCGQPATCIGEYETCTGNVQPACDACCGHGNEDGHCKPVEFEAAGVPSQPQPNVTVAGRLDRTLDDFERACLVHLDEEQRRLSTDNALIAVLCDAVRVKRELVELAAGVASPPPPNRHGYGCPYDGDELSDPRPSDCPCDEHGRTPIAYPAPSPPPPGWQPIESAPTDDRDIELLQTMSTADMVVHVTHWRELKPLPPEAPK